MALPAISRPQLPARLEDLARFVLVGREKLVAVRALIRAESHLEIASGVREQKKGEAQDLADALLDAEVRIGELTRKIPINPGNEKKQKGSAAPLPTKSAITKKLGFEETQIKRFETLSRHPQIVEKVKAEARANDDLSTRTEALRLIALEKREQKPQSVTPILPKAKYRILYADPPWSYGNEQHGVRDEVQGTVLRTHYPPMSIDGLCALPVHDLCASDAVLFLWVTSPQLEDSFRIIHAWGFEYKTSMVWDKVKHNVGNYVSVRHEFILICTRGSCTPDTRKLVDSVYQEDRAEHSRKPEYFREVIDMLYPNGKAIELFRRGERVGRWDVWGDEAK